MGAGSPLGKWLATTPMAKVIGPGQLIFSFWSAFENGEKIGDDLLSDTLMLDLGYSLQMMSSLMTLMPPLSYMLTAGAGWSLKGFIAAGTSLNPWTLGALIVGGIGMGIVQIFDSGIQTWAKSCYFGISYDASKSLDQQATELIELLIKFDPGHMDLQQRDESPILRLTCPSRLVLNLFINRMFSNTSIVCLHHLQCIDENNIGKCLRPVEIQIPMTDGKLEPLSKTIDLGMFRYYLHLDIAGDQVKRIEIVLEFKEKIRKVDGTVGLRVVDSELQKMLVKGKEQKFETFQSFSVT